MKIAHIERESMVDGAGIRMAVFVQGCLRHCPGCHNQHTWDPRGGTEYTTEQLLELYDDNPLLDGITLTGGEPLLQAKELVPLAREVWKRGGTVWLYTGYYLHEINSGNAPAGTDKLIEYVDVIVDGPFLFQERDLSLKFRGSRNQNIWYHSGNNIWQRREDDD